MTGSTAMPDPLVPSMERPVPARFGGKTMARVPSGGVPGCFVALARTGLTGGLRHRDRGRKGRAWVGAGRGALVPPAGMIKYIGSKRVLVPRIVELVRELPDVRTVLDVFSGTARVGHALKAAGYHVTANDHNAYAATLARALVAADGAALREDARALLAELDALPGTPGWFTETYCERARYFQPQNGGRIEAIRNAVADRGLSPDLEAVALTALLLAADRVDSTVGLQMAWLKSWAPRSARPLALRLPDLLDGPGDARCAEAADVVASGSWDLIYLDPPYNQHKYRSNYHVWETLVRWDRPEVYGVACKRVDCRDYHSPFNRPRSIAGALADLVSCADARWLLVSFSDEGFLDRATLEAMLAVRGEVRTLAVDTKRYVGAQIGIYNPGGEKVGRVSHLRNTEFLFLVRVETPPRPRGLPAS